MLQEERREMILNELKKKRSVRINELCKQFGVTRETVRRDLNELEQQGLVKKVHGGAVLNKTIVEPPYQDRSVSNVMEKEAIARKAAEFVEDGDSLFIDLGTTTLMLAKQLRDKKNLTVITNALPIAMEMVEHEHTHVILSGGSLRKGELALSGSVAQKTIEGFYVDKAFIGVGGIDEYSGFTDYHVEEADIRHMMLQRAKETYALVDYSKFHVTAFAKWGDLSDVTTLITDHQAPQQILKKMEEKGVRTVVVDV